MWSNAEKLMLHEIWLAHIAFDKAACYDGLRSTIGPEKF